MALGWGIIGIGRHADNRMAPAIQQAADSYLAAACSQDRSRAEAFVHRHGGGRAYDSYEAMLADPQVAVVYIASPNSLHTEQAVAAARAGKHVLCEKPMALTNEDAQRMVRECRAAGVKLGVGFHLRQYPGHQEARRLIAGGEIGAVVLAEATFGGAGPRRGGWWSDPEMVGAYSLMGRGVHVFDLLRYLVGQEVEEVSAFTNGQTAEEPLEDIALSMLRFAGGAFAYATCAGILPNPLSNAVIYGSKQRIIAENSVGAELGGSFEIMGEGGARIRQIAPVNCYLEEINDFNRAVLQDGEPAAAGVDGLRVVEITVGVLRSRREGRAVRLEHLEP